MLSLLRKAAFCSVLIIGAIWYAQTHFYRDPGSRFFDPARAYEHKYSRHRRAEVDRYIHSQETNQTNVPLRTAKQPTLCLAYASVKRPSTQYLEVAVASALAGLSKQERDDLYLTILIAHTDPTLHPNWSTTWIIDAIDQLYSYNVTEETRKHLESLEQGANYSEKGVFDYVYALEECKKSDADYIGVFEDDIMLADGWMIQALSALRQIPPPSDKSWLYMRLFNQERSIGFETNRIGGNYEHWIILGIWFGVSVPLFCARWRFKAVRQRLDLEWCGVLLGLMVPAAVLLFYQSGKASVLPPAPGVVKERFGCCSQTLIFPNTQVEGLAGYLREQRAGQVDLMINDWAGKAGLEVYALYPVQAQHIGIDSARNTAASEAQAVWSMAFEDLKPATVAKNHERMVEKYYNL